MVLKKRESNEGDAKGKRLKRKRLDPRTIHRYMMPYMVEAAQNASFDVNIQCFVVELFLSM